MENFPRESGHCFSFDVSEYQYIKDLKKSGVRFENFVSEPIVDYDFRSHEVDYDDIFKRTLALLSDKNLVKGDLILFCEEKRYRNEGVAIYDGENIIKLDYEYDEHGTLPKCFTVITNEAPIVYWVNYPRKKGISHNSVVWFDHFSVKQQCIAGAKIENGRVIITFECQGKSYTIYDLTDDQYLDMIPDEDYEPEKLYNAEERLKVVISKLESDELLMLSSGGGVLEMLEDKIKIFLGNPFEVDIYFYEDY